MNEIKREPIKEDYIICFWDKSKIQVSYETGEKLKSALRSGEIKTFEIGNDFYMVSGIEKIITKYKAYDVFPEQFELLKEMASEEINSIPQLESPKFIPTEITFENWLKIHPGKTKDEYLRQFLDGKIL